VTYRGRGAGRRARRRLATFSAALATAGIALCAVAAPARAGDTGEGTGFVTVLKVSGLLDPVLVDFLDEELTRAEADGPVALVLRLDSAGSAGAGPRLDRVLERLANTDVPIAVWVGPTGSRARGDATRLLAAADRTGVAPGASVEVTRELVAARGEGAPDLGRTQIGDRVGAERAADLELVDSAAPVIGEFVLDLDGVESRVENRDGRRVREPVTQVRFAQLPLTGQLLHTVASPAVAYLLFVIGLALLVFELYTAGIGIAGGVGAVCVLLGAYGLATLPTRPVGVALLLLAMFGYAVDVQAGVPRTWTGIATVSFVAGSLLLYDGLSISWITLVVAVVGMTLAMLAGMPAMVRTRFSTPTLGREWMLGETGRAIDDVDPEGVVTIRDARWRARTNRATPIRRGEEVRVVAIDGLTLEVEPTDGAARDYRERSKDSAATRRR
jgi:membrane-bound serine protease (ClpP class)